MQGISVFVGDCSEKASGVLFPERLFEYICKLKLLINLQPMVPFLELVDLFPG